MGNQPFLEKVREWISGIAFDVFLWSIRMSEEEYLNTVSGIGSSEACPECGEPFDFCAMGHYNRRVLRGK